MTLFRFTLTAALALTLSAPAAAQPAAQTIQLYSFGYTPNVIRLAAGRPVTLTFVNTASGGHNFSAPSFFANTRIVSGSAPNGVVEVGAAVAQHHADPARRQLQGSLHPHISPPAGDARTDRGQLTPLNRAR